MKKSASFWIVLGMLTFGSAQSATFNEGLELLRAGDFDASHKAFLAKSQGENPEAMYHLGRSYIRGWGVEKNPAIALEWFEKSFNYPSAFKGKVAYEIGRIYQMAPNLKDYEKAYKWFWVSLENGYGKGHVQLAQLYSQGLGTALNIEHSLYHIERAAKLKYPQSMLSYAKHLKAGDYGPADKREVAIWVHKAIKLLERQARRGSGTAAVRLGKLYLSGELTAKNKKLAVKWLKWGRKHGSALAKRYLAKIGE